MKYAVIFVAMIALLLVSANAKDRSQGQPENLGLENCNCITTFEYLPLCGSNGVTYSNPSSLKCAKKCLSRNDLEKVHDGPCKAN